MPIPITGMRVFIGAPSGLENERRCIREIIDSVNREYALINHDVIYVPLEWGGMTGGTGSPQSRINPKLVECDYCFIIFYNYMGDGNTVIEFEKACGCKKTGGPMREVVVFHKIPTQGELISQSDELKKVLKFLNSIEKDHHHIPFKNEDEFKDLIKKHLIEWLRLPTRIAQHSSVRNFVNENMPE